MFRPYGLYGGSPGRLSRNYLDPHRGHRLLESKVTMTIKRGDVFRHEVAGAGGWGHPLERDPAAVVKDVRNELMSLQAAADEYGVVIDPQTWTVDAIASQRPRAIIHARRGWTEVPKGQREEPPQRAAATDARWGTDHACPAREKGAYHGQRDGCTGRF